MERAARHQRAGEGFVTPKPIGKSLGDRLDEEIRLAREVAINTLPLRAHKVGDDLMVRMKAKRPYALHGKQWVRVTVLEIQQRRIPAKIKVKRRDTGSVRLLNPWEPSLLYTEYAAVRLRGEQAWLWD